VEEIKTSLAMAGNHLTRFTTEASTCARPPAEDGDAGQALRVREHARPGSASCHLITELGLVDYLADRFAVVGTRPTA
jgi:hypothetical protein